MSVARQRPRAVVSGIGHVIRVSVHGGLLEGVCEGLKVVRFGAVDAARRRVALHAPRMVRGVGRIRNDIHGVISVCFCEVLFEAR